ncbi:hypothetical protein ACJX0J_029126, partial [Zea mays]
ASLGAANLRIARASLNQHEIGFNQSISTRFCFDILRFKLPEKMMTGKIEGVSMLKFLALIFIVATILLSQIGRSTSRNWFDLESNIVLQGDNCRSPINYNDEDLCLLLLLIILYVSHIPNNNLDNKG